MNITLTLNQYIKEKKVQKIHSLVKLSSSHKSGSLRGPDIPDHHSLVFLGRRRRDSNALRSDWTLY